MSFLGGFFYYFISLSIFSFISAVYLVYAREISDSLSFLPILALICLPYIFCLHSFLPLRPDPKQTWIYRAAMGSYSDFVWLVSEPAVIVAPGHKVVHGTSSTG